MAIYTQLQYDTLCAAIAQGALEVKYADKQVTYRSLDDMIRIKSLMEADLGLSSSGSSRAIKSTFRSGLNAPSQVIDNNEWN